MQHHYGYVLNSEGRVPGTGGDPKSWLEYYKLNPEAGDTYVQVPESASPRVGGRLWFIVDREVLACANIVLVVTDEINGWREIWYRAPEIVRMTHAQRWTDPHDSSFFQIRSDLAETWLRLETRSE